MTKKKKREPLEGNDACIAMHTALRKCCDSPITSAAYNLVHLVCGMDFGSDEQDPWRIYGRLVADSINGVYERKEKLLNPYIPCKLNIEKLEDAFHELQVRLRKNDARLPDNAREALYALTGVFKCFDTEDWQGMASYLGDE